MTTKLTAISLYTGAGGLDYGFEAAGFKTVVAVELDSKCVQTLKANRRWPIINEPIESVSTRRILQVAELARGAADILIGGPPCQPFSKSGYWATGDAKRLADPRARTLEDYLRVLDEAQPRTFLMENVEGLGFRGKDEGLVYIQKRLHEINRHRGTNYQCSVAVLNAADFGVPQLRRRLFIVGSRDGKAFRFPEPTHVSANEASRLNLGSHRTAWDALHDLHRKPAEDLELRGKWADLLPSIPEGQNYLWHTDRGGGEPLFGWRRRYWSFLLKLAKNAPSWTVQAQPGPATGPFHWDNRRLSIREMCRVQTFPDTVTFLGSYGDAQRQLGNAVPSLLAEVLGRSIRQQLLGRLIRSPLRLSIPVSQTRTPPPERVRAVPKAYHHLIGDHSAHPGTGRGHAAEQRELDATMENMI